MTIAPANDDDNGGGGGGDGGGDAGGIDVGRRRRLRRHKVPATASLLPAWRAIHPTTARRRLIRWPELKRSQ